MEHNFYLSCHGVTHLYNLFVNKDRDPQYTSLKVLQWLTYLVIIN